MMQGMQEGKKKAISYNKNIDHMKDNHLCRQILKDEIVDFA